MRLLVQLIEYTNIYYYILSNVFVVSMYCMLNALQVLFVYDEGLKFVFTLPEPVFYCISVRLMVF